MTFIFEQTDFNSTLLEELRKNDLLVLPSIIEDGKRNNRQIVYKIVEYNPLLDSSDMTQKDWMKIASDIEVNIKFYR